jgi:tetratricopeptide (TPR) repeat protein
VAETGASTRAAILSDLAVAYSTRGSLTEEFRDAIRALDVLEEGFRFTPSSRTLNVQRQQLAAELGLGPSVADSSLLRSAASIPQVDSEGHHFDDDLALRLAQSRDLSSLAQEVERDVEGAFDTLEISWFRAWGEALESGDGVGAEAWRNRARALTEALAITSAERLWPTLFDGQPSGRALRAFARGREAYRERRIDESTRQFSDVLACEPPMALALWSRFYLGAAGFWGDGRRGLSLLQDLSRSPEVAQSPRLLGYLGWMRGLFESQWLGLREASRSLESSVDAFQVSRHRGPETFVGSVLASDAAKRGLTAEAARYLARILPLARRVPSLGHRATIYEVAADVADQLRAPRAALRFEAEAVATARTFDDPSALVQTLEQRARRNRELGDRLAAIADLEEARRAAGRSRDAAASRLLSARLLLAELDIGPSDDGRLEGDIASAITAFRDGSGLDVVPALLSRRAALRRQRGDRDGALVDLREALTVLDDLVVAGRAAHFDQRAEAERRRVLDEIVAAAVDLGAEAEALVGAGAASRWAMRDGLGTQSPEANQFAASMGDVLKVYLLPDRVLRWHLRGGVAKLTSYPFERASLFGKRGEAASPASTALEELAAIVFSDLGPAKRLVVELDPLLDGTSLSDLRRVAPSTEEVVSFARLLPSHRQDDPVSSPGKGLIVADPRDALHPPLPDAARAGEALSDERPSVLLTRAAATKTVVLDALPNAGWFVFAGHFDPSTMTREGGLVLSQEASGASYLGVDDLAQVDLSALGLVLLAACGDSEADESSDGLLQLGRAFLSRGAHRVVVARRPISDQAAAALTLRLAGRANSDDLGEVLLALQREAEGTSTDADFAAFELLVGEVEDVPD